MSCDKQSVQSEYIVRNFECVMFHFCVQCFSFHKTSALIKENLTPVNGTVYKEKISYSCTDEGYYLPNKTICWPCWPDSYVAKKNSEGRLTVMSAHDEAY